MPEHEYQVRLGVSIRVLRDTLPQFLDKGLVDRADISGTNIMNHLLGGPHAPKSEHLYHKQILFRFAPMKPPATISTPTSNVTEEQSVSTTSEMHWTPSFTFRGRRSYLMSAEALRLSLQAGFSSPQVLLEQLSFMRRPPDVQVPGRPTPGDELIARIRFRGTNRISQTLQDYAVVFRYRYDRATGTICEHHVEKMMPVPGQRMWQRMASMRSRLA